MTLPSTVRHRVVIVGSGFGGLFAAKSLAHAPDVIEVILISRTNHHLFQPLLYQVATGILSEGQIAPARRSAVLSAHGVRLSGRLAWYVWLVVHITFMTGFKNWFTALIHWFFSFVGTSRLERAIVIDLNQLCVHDANLSGGRKEDDAPRSTTC